jgi:hypothetical protein
MWWGSRWKVWIDAIRMALAAALAMMKGTARAGRKKLHRQRKCTAAKTDSFPELIQIRAFLIYLITYPQEVKSFLHSREEKESRSDPTFVQRESFIRGARPRRRVLSFENTF